MDDSLAVRNRGWRQGSFLAADSLQPLIGGDGRDGVTHGVIVSQDCDLLHPSFRTEPWAEVLLVSAIPKPDGNLVHGKSPRRFHFQAGKSDGSAAWFEASPWNRLLIPRDRLATVSPSNELALESSVLRTLIQWIADRYTRGAFPDGFVEHTRDAQKALSKALTVTGAAIWRIFLQVTPDRDLVDGEEYEVNVLCLVRPEVWADPKLKADADRAQSSISAALEAAPGISVRAFDYGSTDDFVISELFNYRTWDIFNYLTHRDRLDGEGD